MRRILFARHKIKKSKSKRTVRGQGYRLRSWDAESDSALLTTLCDLLPKLLALIAQPVKFLLSVFTQILHWGFDWLIPASRQTISELSLPPGEAFLMECFRAFLDLRTTRPTKKARVPLSDTVEEEASAISA